MGGMDVFTFNVDFECKEQINHFYKLGLGLYNQGQFVEIDIETIIIAPFFNVITLWLFQLFFGLRIRTPKWF